MVDRPAATPMTRDAKGVFSGTFLYGNGHVAAWKAVFDPLSGFLSSYQVDGKELLAEPLTPSFGRAVTENDMGAKFHEKMAVWLYPQWRLEDWSEEIDDAGTVTLTVQDVEQSVTCRMNSDEKMDTAFQFRDRLNTLYSGSDSVRNGRFLLTFAVPKDISYGDGTGMMKLFVISADRHVSGHGSYSNFTMEADTASADDDKGPSIWCYLNHSSFSNGDAVNPTPYFYAELSDKDGINVAGSGIGHDLELIIDGEMTRTYTLNDYFSYDFGDYRSGTVGFSIPQLSYGPHHLLFRAWDALNNSSTAELDFTVVRALEPQCFTVMATKNPATTSTTFIVNHDRTGSAMDVVLDIFDASGRLLWQKRETGVPTDQTYTIDWDLTTSGGRRLSTGVYLYRVRISSDGSDEASKAKKLIILSNK
jgi:hypothetical protein